MDNHYKGICVSLGLFISGIGFVADGTSLMILGLSLMAVGGIIFFTIIKEVFSELTPNDDTDNDHNYKYDFSSESSDNKYSYRSSYSAKDDCLTPDEIKAYKILGATWNDSDDTIKKKYLKLKRLYGDDNNNFRNNSKKQYGRDKKNINFKALSELEWAWNIIKKTRQLNQSKDKTSRTKESDYKYCLLLLCAQVMKGDGKQMVCELDKVKETIRRYYKTKKQQIDALQNFKEILSKDYDLKNVYQTVNRCLNPVAKTDIIMELLAIAYSDDVFSTVEENIIKEIARNLNIKDETYKSIYTIFVKKYEGRFYEANKNKKESNKKGSNKKNKSEKKQGSNESKSSNNSDNNSNNSNSKSSNRNRISINEAYDILGVNNNISDSEVKKAYRALAIKYHPDNAASLGDEAIRQATETMKQINVAWETVKMARGIR